ncbi:hypothetical protein [Pseudobacter ginsenosidimutans]|uniref:Lipocalin-like protein n=1 Tax=Pseudobacter ginsenosidimutans TaxID=661488 RepID=A0A4Q7MS28_9BACT|nr:hypothetical protein [Pseudobacter ginsenosidimutans]QEC42436.1 hypothetical protein FSB84_12305 [Pseudobacter ginsenosidimutans]RZS70714.1 hypothetical protein EV199_2607 [Pseudobacter ginsenosidimutans]
MKKTVLFSILLSVFFLNSIAQTKEELVGTWTVTKVSLAPNAPKEFKEGYDKMVKGMQHSTMEFEQDGKCKIAILELMAKEAGASLNGKTSWVYNEIDKSIIVSEGSGKSKDTLMKMYVKKEGKKYMFIGDETYLVFDVKKNKK